MGWCCKRTYKQILMDWCCKRTQILMDLLGKRRLNPTQSAQREELWSSCQGSNPHDRHQSRMTLGWCSTILLM